MNTRACRNCSNVWLLPGVVNHYSGLRVEVEDYSLVYLRSEEGVLFKHVISSSSTPSISTSPSSVWQFLIVSLLNSCPSGECLRNLSKAFICVYCVFEMPKFHLGLPRPGFQRINRSQLIYRGFTYIGATYTCQCSTYLCPV